MWSMWKRRASVSRRNLTAFIDGDSKIEGRYTFNGTVLLNGRFQGEIASTDTLIIGERGVVNATVRVGTAIIDGELVGNVVATERIELKGKARVFGDLEAPVVVVHEGVLLEGHCRMTKTKPAEAIRDFSVVPLKR